MQESGKDGARNEEQGEASHGSLPAASQSWKNVGPMAEGMLGVAQQKQLSLPKQAEAKGKSFVLQNSKPRN